MTAHPHKGTSGSKFTHINPDNEMRKIVERNPEIQVLEAANRLIALAIKPLGDSEKVAKAALLKNMLLAEAIRSYWRVKRMLNGDDEPLPPNSEEAKRTVELGLARWASRMTGAQCTAAGGGFAELGRRLKPEQIAGDVFNLDEIVKIMSRQ